jgi:hypothetical protein
MMPGHLALLPSPSDANPARSQVLEVFTRLPVKFVFFCVFRHNQ